MAVTYSTTLKNTRLAAVVTALGASGKLVLGTSALSGATGVLATIPLASTPGTVSAGVLTLSGLPLSASVSAAGTLAKAELRDGSDVVVATGITVGTSAADIIVGTTTVVTGNVAAITAATITE